MFSRGRYVYIYPRLRFTVLSIDYVRVTNRFYDYDYDYMWNSLTTSVHFASMSTLSTARRVDFSEFWDCNSS